MKWIKRQIAAFSLAMSSVEKNTLSQQGLTVDAGVNSEQSHKKGTLEYNLINGEVTQEVKDLRWRMYKILLRSSLRQIQNSPFNTINFLSWLREHYWIKIKRGVSYNISKRIFFQTDPKRHPVHSIRFIGSG